MAKKKNQTRRKSEFWDFPPVTVHRWRPLSQVEYDMGGTAERMSPDAQDRLASFVRGYLLANWPRTEGAGFMIGPTAGSFRALPEHVEEMAARALVHMTHPANFDRDLHEFTVQGLKVYDEHFLDAATGQPRMNYVGQFANMWKEIRRAVEAEFPEFVDDPLGQYPIDEAVK